MEKILLFEAFVNEAKLSDDTLLKFIEHLKTKFEHVQGSETDGIIINDFIDKLDGGGLQFWWNPQKEECGTHNIYDRSSSAIITSKDSCKSVEDFIIYMEDTNKEIKNKYSSSDREKIKSFAKDISDEIYDIHSKKFSSGKLDKKEYTSEEMLKWILAWGYKQDLPANKIITKFKLTTRRISNDLNLI